MRMSNLFQKLRRRISWRLQSGRWKYPDINESLRYWADHSILLALWLQELAKNSDLMEPKQGMEHARARWPRQMKC